MKRFNKKTLAEHYAKPVAHRDWNSEPHKVVKPDEQARIDIMQLETAISGDFRQLPVAYPILVRHGFMERTPNGFKAIDPEAVIARSKALIARLSQ